MPSDMTARSGLPWVIVGGGLLGLSLASELAKKGHRLIVLEAGSVVGGLASAWSLGDFTWDRHYHVTLFSDSGTRNLLRELGLDSDMQWTKTATGFYHAGRLYPFSGALDFLQFPVLNLWEKVQLASTILRASRHQDWQSIEDLTVEEWLTKLSGAKVFAKIWRPLLLAKLGEQYRHTSATFIWATIQRMYAARRNGQKAELFGYLPGGYARLLQTFGEALTRFGVDVRCNSSVRTILHEGPGEQVVHLLDGSTILAERVIVTTPSPVAIQVCPQLTAEEVEAHRRISYIGIICMSVVLRNPLSPYYITNILDPTIPFTGLIEMSALVNRQEFCGRSLLYIPRYLPPQHADFNRSEEELTAESLTALFRMHPGLRADDVLTTRISRARHVFACPTPGYSRFLPEVDTSLSGISIINSAQIVNGTLNVNETIALAQKEALRLDAKISQTNCQPVNGSRRQVDVPQNAR